MIINEIYFEEINRIFDEIHAGVQGIRGCKEKLKYFNEHTLGALLEHKDFFANYVRCLEKLSENQNTKKMFTTFYDRYSNEFANIVEQGIQNGELQQIDIACATRAAYCMLTGIVFLRYSMKIDFDLNDQNNKQFDLLINASVKR
jgi:hypothetical protein